MGLPPVEPGEPREPRDLPGPREPRESARPATGDARVDEAVARLAELDGLPVGEHPAVYEYVHERLTEALGDLDVRDPARPGPQGQPRPGPQGQGQGQGQGQWPRRPGPPGRPGG
jgi:hypothetical protein